MLDGMVVIGGALDVGDEKFGARELGRHMRVSLRLGLVILESQL